MTLSIKRSSFALVFGILWGAAIGVQAQTQTPQPTKVSSESGYNFSPVNQYKLEQMAEYWNPILAYVSDKSGVPLNLLLGRTTAQTAASVLTGESDFAFTNQLFTPDRVKLGWHVFARRDLPPLKGQVVVGAESPIKTLADLDGKTVSFPGPEAFMAYTVTVAQLSAKKINVTPVYAGNLNAAISQMVAGRADATGSNSQMVAEYASRENRKFRVLWSSPPYYDLALMASPRVPAAKVKAVAKAFVGMNKDPVGQHVLEAAAHAIQATTPHSFVASTEADYAAYRDFYRRAQATLH